MGGLVPFVLNPAWMAWASVPIPAALRCARRTGALGIWTFRSLGRNITDTVVTRREHTLITSGPYRYVRHPYQTSFHRPRDLAHGERYAYLLMAVGSEVEEEQHTMRMQRRASASVRRIAAAAMALASG